MRATLDAEDFLGIVLVLVVIWLVIEVIDTVLEITLQLLWPLQPLVGLVTVLLIVLWFFDRIWDSVFTPV